MAEQYSIVFTGKILESFDLHQVQSNLARLFNKDIAALQPLFSGGAVVIRKNLSRSEAEKYQLALSRAGAECEIHAPGKAAAPGSTEHAQQPGPSAALRQASLAPAGTVLVEAAPVAPRQIDTSGMILDPPGVQILPPSTVAPAPLPPSDLTMAGPGETLVEPTAITVPEIETGHIQMAPTGADLDHRKPPPEPNIDITGMSMAPPGTDILDKS